MSRGLCKPELRISPRPRLYYYFFFGEEAREEERERFGSDVDHGLG